MHRADAGAAKPGDPAHARTSDEAAALRSSGASAVFAGEGEVAFAMAETIRRAELLGAAQR